MIDRDLHIFRFFLLALLIIGIFIFVQWIRFLPEEGFERSIFLVILLMVCSGFAGYLYFRLYHARLQLFERIFENSYDAITIIDKKGNYQWQNAKNIEFCGFPNEEMLGKKAYLWIDQFAIGINEELDKTDAFFGMFKIDTLFGHKDVFISAFKITDELGETVAYVEFKRCAKQYAQIIELTNREKERLKQLIQYDSLTGILNRRGFYESVTIRNIEWGTIIFIDIDYFKRINDNQGHGIGDVVLQSVAKCLEEGMRTSDIVARFGGEEFIIWIDSDVDHTYEVCEKLRFTIATHAMNVTCSFGIASLEDSTLEEAIHNADQAMYRAKELGKNRVEIYRANT